MSIDATKAYVIRGEKVHIAEIAPSGGGFAVRYLSNGTVRTMPLKQFERLATTHPKDVYR